MALRVKPQPVDARQVPDASSALTPHRATDAMRVVARESEGELMGVKGAAPPHRLFRHHETTSVAGALTEPFPHRCRLCGSTAPVKDRAEPGGVAVLRILDGSPRPVRTLRLGGNGGPTRLIPA